MSLLRKRLQDMTLEELWELFPIVLVPHQGRWSEMARREMEELAEVLAEFRPVISHIGSTAVPEICAKPIVDILVEVEPTAQYTQIKDQLERAGYICMSESAGRMSFNKGYTPEGYADEVYHVHIHASGDRDEVLFRDYLIAHPEVASEYEGLKLRLLPRYRNDRDGYTDAKTEFVRRIVALAKEVS